MRVDERTEAFGGVAYCCGEEAHNPECYTKDCERFPSGVEFMCGNLINRLNEHQTGKVIPGVTLGKGIND